MSATSDDRFASIMLRNMASACEPVGAGDRNTRTCVRALVPTWLVTETRGHACVYVCIHRCTCIRTHVYVCVHMGASVSVYMSVRASCAHVCTPL